MNKSKQREVILEVLKSTTSHPTAEWVHDKAKALIPNISLGTVYRNLGQLLENGDIIKVAGSFEKDRFDGNPIRHAHFVCEKCGAVLDIEINNTTDIELMGIGSECLINNYNLVYYGLCPLCKY